MELPRLVLEGIQPIIAIWFFLVIFGKVFGELAGEGSVAVAVGIGDRWHEMRDMSHVINLFHYLYLLKFFGLMLL